MIIDFSQKIEDLNHEPLRKKDRDFCLSDVCVDALLILDLQDSKGVDGKEKVIRYELAKELHKGGRIEISTDEIHKIKKLVGKAYLPLVVGQAFAMLENKHEAHKESSSEVEKKEVVEDERISKD